MSDPVTGGEKPGRAEADPRLNEFLYRHGLAHRDEEPSWFPLAGGVSSDIWRVELGGRSVCVKRALARLKVAADWRAPVSRNHYEWEWLCFVARLDPAVVPRPLAHDEGLQILATQYLPPDEHPVWKSQLMNGTADRAFAAAVGSALASIHSASAGSEEVARVFDSGENFHSLRIDPYLLATAERHPDLAPAIESIAEVTFGTHKALVHGDVSPKNILVGPRGPVFLDAECAWYGDPAFDCAFCLNHFLLKCVARPTSARDFIACFDSFSESYLGAVDWEPRPELEARCARLLPILFLARVDGKSPVEYITEEYDKGLVRGVARQLIVRPQTEISAVALQWLNAVTGF